MNVKYKTESNSFNTVHKKTIIPTEHDTKFLTNNTLVLVEGLKRAVCFTHVRTKSGLKIAILIA